MIVRPVPVQLLAVKGKTLDRLKPYFSAAAREAAQASRRRREAEREAAKGQLVIYAVRLGTGFSWEVRQFGGLILAKGTECYSSSDDALSAGNIARKQWRDQR